MMHLFDTDRDSRALVGFLRRERMELPLTCSVESGPGVMGSGADAGGKQILA
jgi:hypothetical protein